MNPQTNNPDPNPTGGVPPAAGQFYTPPPIVSTAEPREGVQPSTLDTTPDAAFRPPQVPLPPPPPVSQAIPTPPLAQPLAPPVPVGGAMPIAPKVGEPLLAAPKPKNAANSTQNTLQIAEIRDGIVIMNDGSFRAVVMVKSINFDLMSPQEQEAVEYSYQGFLNSLYFPMQIFINSRKVDLRPYIEKLDKIRTEHDNMLLALLMEDYINYMSDLSQQTNIMDKRFYVVIPFFPFEEKQQILTQNKNFLTGITKLFDRKEEHIVINEADLEKAKTELRNRVQAVLSGLSQCGVQGLPLDTEELIELYYDTYNPDTATRQRVQKFDNLTADVVTKGQGTVTQAHLQQELQ